MVDGGWPDPSTASLVTAYVKTGLSKSSLSSGEPAADRAHQTGPGSTFMDEAMWLRRTGQLLAEGRYDGNNFIVFSGVTGKTELVATTFFRDQLSAVAMGETDRTRCEALLRPKLALIVHKVKAYVYGPLFASKAPSC